MQQKKASKYGESKPDHGESKPDHDLKETRSM
jgi:hypothetical protein